MASIQTPKDARKKKGKTTKAKDNKVTKSTKSSSQSKHKSFLDVQKATTKEADWTEEDSEEIGDEDYVPPTEESEDEAESTRMNQEDNQTARPACKAKKGKNKKGKKLGKGRKATGTSGDQSINLRREAFLRSIGF